MIPAAGTEEREMNTQNYQWNSMTMGTCYYPEHWDKKLWESDLDRMLDAGISVIRIAEFAWTIMEPEEGRYDFSFFDEFLDLCEKKGMNVIFCTPTATPPAWLTEKYPETLNARKDGVMLRHGGRRHYNYNSPKYRELCTALIEREAQHYGQHPAIIGWQIDNELNCETNEFYSEADTAAFRVFLQKKYGTLDALNEAWGAVFWNQTYTDWQQVYVPRPGNTGAVNPHQHLDYIRFISESAVSFCDMQAQILRKYKKPGDFITTNGMFGHLDNHRMAGECLDFYTYDSYPDFGLALDRDPKTAKDLNDRKWTKNLTEVRSICPHFGIMEQQSGGNGWTTRMEAPAPRPGQLTLWAMQSVAQGADFVSFFRWRTAVFGTEIYWHGILDYDSRDNRKLAEVKDFYSKLKTLEPVCGAENAVAFGVLDDYDNLWDAEVDVWHGRFAWASDLEIFAASDLTHTPYDKIYLRNNTSAEDLRKYSVLFYPHPVIMTEERAALLKNYVSEGGTLVVGCRAGLKDEHGHCVMMPQPGLLAELTGTDVRDFTFVSGAEEPVTARMTGSGQTAHIPMPVYNDVITPLEGTQVLATYDSSYYAGEAALTEHAVGKGRVLHLGSAFSRENTKAILRYLGILSPFAELVTADPEIELVMREKEGRKFLFVLNFAAAEKKYSLKKEMRRMYDGAAESGDLVLPPFGTMVYEV